MLILRYYSFENYFLDPKVMAEIGIVDSEKSSTGYFWRNGVSISGGLHSGRRLVEVIGHDLENEQDVEQHMKISGSI